MKPKSLTPILPVLRKLADVANISNERNSTVMLTISYDNGETGGTISILLGDCRKVKRWLAQQDKKK